MFTAGIFLAKIALIGFTAFFFLAESSRRRDKASLWLALAMLLFMVKEAILLYLLQRPPATGVPTIGEFFSNLSSLGLPLGVNVPLPIAVFHHFFLVMIGLEMLLAIAWQQAFSSVANQGRNRGIQLSVLLVNFVFAVSFGALAFTVTEYHELSDMLNHYLLASAWACLQYIGFATLVWRSKQGEGLRVDFVPASRYLLLGVSLFSLLQVVLTVLVILRAFVSLPFLVFALVWHASGLLWLLVAWLYQVNCLKNSSLEKSGAVLRHEIFREMGRSVTETLSMNSLVELLSQKTLELLNAEVCGLFIVDEEGERIAVGSLTGFFPPAEPIKIEENTTPEILLSRFRANRIRLGKTYIGEVAAKGEILEVKDNLSSKTIPQTGGKWLVIKQALAIPLRSKKRTYGVLVALNSKKSRGFSLVQKKLVKLLADEAGPLLRQSRRYQRTLLAKQTEREFSIAVDIQKKLMPQRFPEQEGLEISSFSRVAKEGGGDYYDLLDFGKGRLGFVCADIAGKGVAASLVMVIIRSIIRSNATSERDAATVVGIVNDTLSSEVGEERFASMYYFQYDSRHRVINYCNAGHSPLLLFRARQKNFAQLDTDGMPIGIEENVEYGQYSTSLESGDIAVLFTDGVVEAMNSELQQFGLSGLQEAIKENYHLSASELTDKIYEAINSFTGEAEQIDDATLLLMKVV